MLLTWWVVIRVLPLVKLTEPVSASSYVVSVTVTTTGIINLDAAPGNDITDIVGNSMTTTTAPDPDESFTVDTTRFTPSVNTNTPSPTNQQSITFKVDFDEPIDTTTFTASDVSASQGIVSAPTTDNNQTFEFTITALTAGTLTVSIPADSVDDLAQNKNLVSETLTITVDTTAPSLTSITRSSPTSELTSLASLEFAVTFSESVTGVDTSDFAISGTGTGSVSNISGSDSIYIITVDVTSNSGTIGLDLVANNHDIIDSAGTALTDTSPDPDETYTIDAISPSLTSITRNSPTTETTSETSLDFAVTFSEDVTGVDATDFVISQDSTGTGSITLTGSDNVYYVTVSAVQDGTYNLDLVSSGHGITDEASNPLTDTTPTGADHTYTVNTVPADTTAPTLSSIERSSPVTESTDSQTLIYKVTFSEDVTGVTQSDFALSSDSTGAANSVTSISGSGSQYFVTVSATQDGTYNLDLISSGHGIEDAAENPLTDTSSTGADETYTVSTVVADTTAPRLSSIERFNPSNATTSSQTLVYEVTFSEDVTGVDTTDFALSSDSTGGTDTGQFTQTNSPDIDVTADDSTISDTITVADSGTVTSLSLAVDVSHTYKGDLKVDLIAPDGTTKTVHNRSGGTADDIDQTYTPDFAGVSIAGTWTLRINDNYPSEDDGTLNSWTLTINHDGSSSTGTANLVTSLSGSGSTYYVTVSAVQDGTYNLDLVSSGHGIVDIASNPLTNTTPTSADHTYTVSTTG